MILYFKEKSKKAYLGWGIVILCNLAFLYMVFIWGVQMKQVSTLQIIHAQQKFIDVNIKKEGPTSENSPKGEYLYIASKKGKYYYPKNCPKAKVLSVKNMLYFKDKMSAEGSGFKPYLGCF